MEVVRRDPSYEDVASPTKEEEYTTNKVQLSNINEDVSDEIFDYENEIVDENDGINSDQVYGGYNSPYGDY